MSHCYCQAKRVLPQWEPLDQESKCGCFAVFYPIWSVDMMVVERVVVDMVVVDRVVVDRVAGEDVSGSFDMNTCMA
jgi:hypothetical protein